MSESKVRITVVIAVYNGVKTLERCLNSIARQKYINKELIVIDGGSTDGSIDILKSNSSIVEYWESEPDRGIYHAWNKALVHATGDWVYFLGADDVFHSPNVLEEFARIMAKMNRVPLVAYGKIEYCKGNSRTLIGDDWSLIKNKMKCGMYIPHQGVFHHKSIFKRCGNFDDWYQIAGDYKLLLKSLRYDDPVFLGNFVVADQYAGGKSSERSMRWKVINEFRVAQKELEISWSFCWFWAYTKAQVWRWLT